MHRLAGRQLLWPTFSWLMMTAHLPLFAWQKYVLKFFLGLHSVNSAINCLLYSLTAGGTTRWWGRGLGTDPHTCCSWESDVNNTPNGYTIAAASWGSIKGLLFFFIFFPMDWLQSDFVFKHQPTGYIILSSFFSTRMSERISIKLHYDTH